MVEDGYAYDELVHTALTGVVREVMRDAGEHGLPGRHHFYITFATRHPGVQIPDYLIDQYPDEMPLILQHQFWGLEVDGDAFEVTLSFKGSQERLRVPFDAITTFADPSVNFVLRLRVAEEAAEDEGEETTETIDESETAKEPSAEDGDNVVSIDAFRKS